MLLPGVGEAGQERLLASTALLLGCGALGSVIADTLARAGVGHLVIVDRDFVELTNLQRQVLFSERDVHDAMPKAEAAKRKIADINSGIRVTAIVDDVDSTNIANFAEGSDIIVDGLDNFDTRYLANDLAVLKGLPYVYGGAVGTVGMAFAILPHTPGGSAPWETLAAGSRATPCFRCLFEEAPPPGTSPTCDTVGVIAPAVSMIASYQAAETLKLLTGNYDRVSPTMLNIDLWSNAITQLKVSRAYDEGDCPCCKRRHFEYLDDQAGSRTTTLCGRDAVQLSRRSAGGKVDLAELATRLRAHGRVRVNEFMLRAELRDNDQPYELSVFPDGRAIVKGTSEERVARSLFAKYVGS